MEFKYEKNTTHTKRELVAIAYRRTRILNKSKHEQFLINLFLINKIPYKFRKIFYREKSFFMPHFTFYLEDGTKLIIEIYSEYKKNKKALEEIGIRNEWLAEQGYKVVQIHSNDLFKNKQVVIDILKENGLEIKEYRAV